MPSENSGSALILRNDDNKVTLKLFSCLSQGLFTGMEQYDDDIQQLTSSLSLEKVFSAPQNVQVVPPDSSTSNDSAENQNSQGW